MQKKASVRFEGGVTEENAGERVKAARDALALVAEKSGISFVITDEISNRENGHYDPKTNTIYLSPDAGKSGQRTILWTASHELVHAVKEAGVDDFNLLADTLMEAYGKKGVNIDALVAIEQEKAARAGAELSFRDAYEEVVAQAMQDFLTDSEQGFFRTMQNLEAKKPGIGEILLEAIQKILQRIAGIYNGMRPTDAAYAYVGRMNEELGRMYEIMTRALTGEATASQQSTKADTKKAASKEGGVKYQYNENLAQQLEDWLHGGGKANGSYNGEFFDLGTTPDILLRHGAKNRQLIMTQDVLVKVTGGKHSISLDEIAQLPSQLNDPILLFKGNVDNSFIALTELLDKNGNDVVVAVHINRMQGRERINKIASLYSKSDANGNNHIVSFVQNQVEKGNLLDRK